MGDGLSVLAPPFSTHCPKFHLQQLLGSFCFSSQRDAGEESPLHAGQDPPTGVQLRSWKPLGPQCRSWFFGGEGGRVPTTCKGAEN